MNKLEEKILEANKPDARNAFLAIPDIIKSGTNRLAEFFIKNKVGGKSGAKKVVGDTLDGFYDRHAYNPYMERAMVEFGKAPKVIFSESMEGVGENQVLCTEKTEVFGPMGLVTKTVNDVYPTHATNNPNSGESVLDYHNSEYDSNYEGIMRIDGKYVYINFVHSGDRQSGAGLFHALTRDIESGEYSATKEEYSNSCEMEACGLYGIYGQITDYFQNYLTEVSHMPNCSIVQVSDGVAADSGSAEMTD